MVKGIIFDLGDVMYTFDKMVFAERIAKNTDKPATKIYQMIFHSTDVVRRYEHGDISSEQFFEEISDLCDLDIGIEEFRKAYTEIYTPVPEVFAIIEKLQGKYKLGIMSNSNPWDIEYLKELSSGFKEFQASSLSYELKAMKPDRRIYEDIAAKLGLPLEECVYIDDIKHYADAAERIGMKGIHYKNPKQLAEELKKLGVEL